MASDNYLASLVDEYYRKLSMGRPVTPTRGQLAAPAGNPLAALRDVTLPPIQEPSRLEGAIGPNSRLGKVIDVLSRPAFSVGNQLKNVVQGVRDIQDGTRESSIAKSVDRGDNSINTLFNATTGSALSGFAGRSKVLPSDAVFEGWEPKSTAEGVGRFAAGFALDVALDPLTYIPGAAFVAAGKKIPGATKAVESLRKAGHLEKKGVTTPPPPDTIQPTPAGSDFNRSAIPTRADIKDAAKGQLPTSARQGMLGLDRESIKSVSQQITPPPPEPFTLSSFATAIQKSVTDAASVKRTAEGKKVYDFRRLDNLYVKPRPGPKASKPETPMTMKLWQAANASRPISVTDDGKMIFSSADDTDALTLQEALDLAKGTQQRTGNITYLRQIRQLYDETAASASGSTSAAGSAADGAARQSNGPTRAERIRGAEAIKRLDRLKTMLEPEDYNYLVRARSEASYKQRRAEILARTYSPVESSSIVEAPAASPLRQLLGEEVTPKELSPRQVLNPTNPTVQKAVSRAVNAQLRPVGYKYRSGRKNNARTNVKVGKGTAIADKGFNKRAQYEMWRTIIKENSDALKSSGVAGSKRAELMRQRVLPQINEAEAVLRSRGIEPILGEAHTGIALSLGDILNVLDSTDAGRKVLLNNVFDIKKASVAPTALMDAALIMIETMKKAGIRDTSQVGDFLRTARATSDEADSLFAQMGRAIVRDPGGDYTQTTDAIARRIANDVPVQNKGIVKRETTRTWDKKGKHSAWSSKTVALGGDDLNSAANQILRALTAQPAVLNLVRRNIANSERYGAHLGYEVQQISAPVIDEFFDTWLRPTTSTGEAIAAYNAVPKAIDAAADSIDATTAARSASDEVVSAEIADELAEDLPTIRNINRAVSARTIGAPREVGLDMHRTFAAEAVENLPAAKIVDVGENIGAAIEHNMLRSFWPMSTKTPEGVSTRFAKATDYGLSRVVAQTGHATIRPALTSQNSVVRNVSNYWRDQLTQVHKAFPDRAQLVPHMIRIQNGAARNVEGLSAQQIQALDKFEHLVKVLFEPSDRADAATGIFFRNALQVEHTNGKFAQMKMPEHMRFDAESAQIIANRTNTPIRTVLADQWRSWKIDDPIDFVARVQASAISALGDAAISREVARISMSKGLMSFKYRDGYVQITDTSGKSVLTRYLPEGAYYHPDIVPEIKAMDDVLRQSLTFDSPFGMFVNRYLDPFLNMWKAGMTIYRPGHHVRNLVGDSGLSFLADGLPKVHQPRNALKIMALRGNYDDFSALRALQGLGPDAGKVTEANLLRGEEKIVKFKVRGKEYNLTAKEVHDYVRSKGMLPDFVSGEDLIQSADRASDTVRAIQEATSIFGGNVRRAAGRVSEARDDYVRLTHFLQILEKGVPGARNVDEALEYAVRRVRKYHPDGTDLTPFETKVMRRLFPFYSWTKKSIPLVVESMLMHPGRIMVYPKAMYSAAQASGIDLTSISDPFPEDQLFPSFLEDEMTGPIADVNGHYYNINPGLPNVDLMNQFIGAPGESIMGMLTPFIKAPIEARTETRMDTQAPINDMSEYVASNIPGVAQANSLTGVDIIGSLLSAAQGQPGIQNLRTVDKGNRDNLDPEVLINFLSGLGLQDMSKPSYINYAEIEKRNEAYRRFQQGQ